MAIVSAVPGLEVTIEIDNVPLPEYPYEDEDEASAADDSFSNTVTKYLEVPSGAEFSVRWLLKTPFEPTAATYADVYLDGNHLQAPFTETGDRDEHRGYKYSRTMSKHDGQGYTQAFRFSELDVDDSTHHTTGALKRQLKDTGCIIVYLYHVVSEAESHITDVPQLELEQRGPVNEKIAQKCAPTPGDVLTHQASLTAPQAQRASMFHHVETAPEPFASFTFHYRSTRALKSLGVVPRTPSLSPSPERDPDTMTRAELIAALARTQEHTQRYVRIKREREETRETTVGADDDEPVWTGSRPAKRRQFVVLDE